MVICLDRGADDLHMVQLVPLPPQHHLLLHSFKNQTGLTILVLAYQFVIERRPLNGESNCGSAV